MPPLICPKYLWELHVVDPVPLFSALFSSTSYLVGRREVESLPGPPSFSPVKAVEESHSKEQTRGENEGDHAGFSCG